MIKKADHYMIIGAGGSIKEYRSDIISYIEKHRPVTIGINRMTSLCYPDYHLWTNNQRFIDFGNCIDPEKSKILFGNGVTKKNIRKHCNGKYEVIKYIDKDGAKMHLGPDKICGRFRTAGALAIALAYVSGAKVIDVVGMDGYTRHSKKDINNKKASQHCYGSGHSDDSTWKDCIKKDKLVNLSLHELKNYGVNFRVITPTKFVDFYDKSVL